MTNTITFRWSTGNIEIAACAVLDMSAAQLKNLVKTATANAEEVKNQIAEYITSEIEKLNPKSEYDKKMIAQYNKLISAAVGERRQTAQEKAIARIMKNCNREEWTGVIHDAEMYCVLDGFRLVRYAAPLDNFPTASQTFDTNKAIGDKSRYNIKLALPTVKDLKADMKIAKLSGIDVNRIHVINSKRMDFGYDFGFGLPMVNAKWLIDMLEALPDAAAYAVEGRECNPLYFVSGKDDGILLPIRRANTSHLDPAIEAVAKPIEKPVEEVKTSEEVKEDPTPAVDEVKKDPAPEVNTAENKLSAVKINQIEAPLEKRQVYGYKPDGNTVVAHRWKVFHLSGNLYLQEPQVDQYKQRFAHLALFFPGVKIGLDIGMLTGWQLDQYSAEDVENKCGCPTVDTFSAMIKDQMESDGHIKNTYIAFVNQYDREFAKQIEEYKAKWLERRAKKNAEWQAECLRKQEQQHREREQEIAEDIANAEQAIMNGGTIDNVMLDGKCVFLRLFDKYEIDIAIRTRGWIINKLTSVIQKDNGGASLTFKRRTKTEKISQSFVNAYFQLRDMLIKEKQEKIKNAEVEQTEKEAADMRVAAVAAVVNDDAAHVPEYVGHYIEAYKRGMITEDEAKDALLRYTVPLALPAHEEAAQDTTATETIQIAAVINPAVMCPSARYYRRLQFNISSAKNLLKIPACVCTSLNKYDKMNIPQYRREPQCQLKQQSDSNVMMPRPP